MDLNEKVKARRRVLEILGLASIISTDYFDIPMEHRKNALQQGAPGQYLIDSLTIEVPSGIYHPTPESSSLRFIHNIQAMNKPEIPRMLEIGAGSGVISLFVANRWHSRVIATDILPKAVAAIEDNARRNNIQLTVIESDLFDAVSERNFDLIVFNAPFHDKEPEDDLERANLCDPGGRTLRRFLERTGEFLAPRGLTIFSIYSNTAYEVLNGIDLKFHIISLELDGSGLWWALVGAQNF